MYGQEGYQISLTIMSTGVYLVPNNQLTEVFSTVKLQPCNWEAVTGYAANDGYIRTGNLQIVS